MPDDQDKQQVSDDQSASEISHAGVETSKSVSFDVEGDVPASASAKIDGLLGDCDHDEYVMEESAELYN